jgi:allophanate hydrolase subunit 2
MPSEGVSWGAIQVPPDGQPIVLGVDHQTTGGYPILGTVCSVDLPRLGQLRPRDTIRFRIVDVATARALHAEQARTLQLLLTKLGR